jgi:hypothetical protein
MRHSGVNTPAQTRKEKKKGNWGHILQQKPWNLGIEMTFSYFILPKIQSGIKFCLIIQGPINK